MKSSVDHHDNESIMSRTLRARVSAGRFRDCTSGSAGWYRCLVYHQHWAPTPTPSVVTLMTDTDTDTDQRSRGLRLLARPDHRYIFFVYRTTRHFIYVKRIYVGLGSSCSCFLCPCDSQAQVQVREPEPGLERAIVQVG
ncbi:hypothetical protein BV22DRAFT_473092 [Leucogyrophana mollusca]|uniref:Uncharacterized protein n=1 Tax=Leucogyrophana mollusca TaxID=85980 RepID=A0ACB8BKA1_9AGAM|nr:hypothetical protein BV22DRAFT_473092 [Leucogyrophana mollusca]